MWSLPSEFQYESLLSSRSLIINTEILKIRVSFLNASLFSVLANIGTNRLCSFPTSVDLDVVLSWGRFQDCFVLAFFKASTICCRLVPVRNSVMASKTNFSWAEQPLQLISSISPTERPFPNKIGIFFARHMAVLHNILSRGFNAACNQAMNVKAGSEDAANLLIFSQFLFEFISSHHQVEDDIFFPAIEKANHSPGLTSNNSKQHQSFHAGLEEFGDYVNTTSKEEYEAKRYLAILKSFRVPMQQHLRDEVFSFLDLKDEYEAALMGVHNESRDIAIAKMDPYR